MYRKKQMDFEQACTHVSAVFPIPDYVDISFRCQMAFIVESLKKNLPVFAGQRLLDIGSGPMDKTAIFQLMGLSCFAADDLSDTWHLRDDNVERIKRFAREVGIEFFQQESDNYGIPFERSSFDVVCSLGVIEHLHESPRELLNAMGEFVKPSGLLIVGTPNSVNLRKRLSVLVGRSNHVPVDQLFHSSGIWRGHVREYTLSDLSYVCREAGFEVVAAQTFEHLAQRKLRRPMRNLYMTLGNLMPSLRSGLLAICRKPVGWSPRMADDAEFRRAIKRSVPVGVS